MQEYRRKQFFTNKKYQLKYTSIIILAMLLIAVVIGATIYRDFSQLLSAQYITEPVSWDKYAVRIVFLLVTVFFIGIFFSHKIIGPLNRLEVMLREMNSGKFDGSIKLRTGDDFRKLSEEINNLASKLKFISEKHPQIKDDFKNES